ncbi:Cfr10I/Bse634I family restriction endonuclease [Psychromonas sp. MME2]|uniref:Cfr10I/Bse634I family restriction endonuclease n=1 Tax=Psychromonas sp. MME2 TaxID=3231033 RepID=UPI00339D1E47
MKLDGEFQKSISGFTPDSIDKLEKSYQHFIGKCSFENISGYLSVKTTFRPDCRLQLSHEGSLMKATYVHLQTRDWVINPKGLKYYGAATKISDADRRGLRTVATHSILDVQATPQAAVDEVFTINSNSNCDDAFKIILNE